MQEENTTQQEEQTAPNVQTVRKINEWDYNFEHGSWGFFTDEITISVSFWHHEMVENAWLACIRWEYQMNHYATYVKIQLDQEKKDDIEQLLIHASGFVTKWLAEQKDKDEKEQV